MFRDPIKAFIDDPVPSYLTPEFLQGFQSLPDSFYSPDAPERFMEFINKYGTHFVKAVSLGGKFTMKRTSRNSGEVSIDDFQQSIL